MDFHGIEMQGYFKAQTVLDASALSWVPNDEGKIVFDETTEDLWIANDTDWVSSSRYVDTPLGTEMWIYDSSAPDGWSISAVAGDELLAVKGGTYAVGGTVYGSWSTPTHAHTLSNHTHSTSGTVGQNYSNSFGSNRSGGDEVVGYHSSHTYSATSYTLTPSNTDTSGSVSTYRPESRVGLICERT